MSWTCTFTNRAELEPHLLVGVVVVVKSKYKSKFHCRKMRENNETALTIMIFGIPSLFHTLNGRLDHILIPNNLQLIL
jgi:hypothetical protein